MNIALTLFGCVLLAILVLAASGPAVRFHLVPFPLGLRLLAWGALAAFAAGGCALAALAVPRLRNEGMGWLLAGAVLGLGGSLVPLRAVLAARSSPRIHDILPLRAGARNSADYGGPEVAAAQRRAYPEVRPLELTVPAAVAYARALAAARAMDDWEIVASDPASGRIEATATSSWFGFKDDVVVRVTPTAQGSRVDVRSASRVGRSDVGANAARITGYLAKVGERPPA
jgi:uncharacterized protein (DUF1499 family)